MSALGTRRIGFVGGGNMAEALVRGLLAAGVVPAAQIRVSDPSPERRQHLQREHGIHTADDNAALAGWADVLVLAVKPQHAVAALHSFAAHHKEGGLVLSICAGIRTASIERELAAGRHVVRAMPNTAAMVLAAATAIAKGASADDADLAVADALFRAVGRTVVVDEHALDAVTGLSGSGPAYVMVFIEALADGGVRAGLPRAVALELATQTVLGSAKLALESGEHPAVLRDRVTSPGGTTAAGLAILERDAVRGSIADAVVAASDRARELAG